MVKSVCSIPERFWDEVLTKGRYTKLRNFTFIFIAQLSWCQYVIVCLVVVLNFVSGEIIQVTIEGVKPVAMVARPDPHLMPAFCIFEYIYFARPDSMFEGTGTCFVAIALEV